MLEWIHNNGLWTCQFKNHLWKYYIQQFSILFIVVFLHSGRRFFNLVYTSHCHIFLHTTLLCSHIKTSNKNENMLTIYFKKITSQNLALINTKNISLTRKKNQFSVYKTIPNTKGWNSLHRKYYNAQYKLATCMWKLALI